MNVLVMGGAGYVGGALTDLLLESKHSLRVYDALLYEESYRKPVDFVYGDDLLEAIAARCTEAESGARAIDHLLTQTLLPQISVEFLTRMAASEPFSRVEVLVDQGTFQYRMT